jgi:phosphatidylserine decarboxylase
MIVGSNCHDGHAFRFLRSAVKEKIEFSPGKLTPVHPKNLRRV